MPTDQELQVHPIRTIERNVVRTESEGEECFISAIDFKAWIDLQLTDPSLTIDHKKVYHWVRDQVHALDEYAMGVRHVREYERMHRKQTIRG